jgi:hypothetical protein
MAKPGERAIQADLQAQFMPCGQQKPNGFASISPMQVIINPLASASASFQVCTLYTPKTGRHPQSKNDLGDHTCRCGLCAAPGQGTHVSVARSRLWLVTAGSRVSEINNRIAAITRRRKE